MQEPLELFEPVRLQVPFEIKDLPQEIVNHIISYVPEYGFLVNLELHELSLEVQEASAYCDFYRFAARSVLDRFDTCTEIYDATIDKAERDIAARYLGRHLRDLLCRYLNDKDSVPVFLLERLGIKSASYLTEVKCMNGGGYVAYQQVSYRTKIIRFYSLIILYDSGIIGKKEFEHRCREFPNVPLLLEIIMVVFLSNEHIYNIVIRYFPSLMEDVIGRLENKCALVQEIIYEDAYRFSVELIRERLSCKKIVTGIDRSLLRIVRDKIMNRIDYNIHKEYGITSEKVFFMIDSLADEE